MQLRHEGAVVSAFLSRFELVVFLSLLPCYHAGEKLLSAVRHLNTIMTSAEVAIAMKE